VTLTGGTLDLGGLNATIGSLAGTGGQVTSGSGASVLTVDQSIDTRFAGMLVDGTSALSLVKLGAGTLTLLGQSSYGGGTTIAPARWRLAPATRSRRRGR
jgi:autotransporter-associated beta strand protein